jgi:hypothetical protein
MAFGLPRLAVRWPPVESIWLSNIVLGLRIVCFLPPRRVWREAAEEKSGGKSVSVRKCAEMGNAEFRKKSTICSCGCGCEIQAAAEMGKTRPDGQAKNRRKHGRFRLFPTEENQKYS